MLWFQGLFGLFVKFLKLFLGVWGCGWGLCLVLGLGSLISFTAQQPIANDKTTKPASKEKKIHLNNGFYQEVLHQHRTFFCCKKSFINDLWSFWQLLLRSSFRSQEEVAKQVQEASKDWEFFFFEYVSMPRFA